MTHQVIVLTDPSMPGYRDEETITQNFLGPKGGGRLEYATKKFAVATEATFGYLHTSGTYTDLQSQPVSGGTISYPPFIVGGIAWSTEVNWRSTLAIPVTSHLAVTLTYERRTLNTSNGDYIFGSNQGVILGGGGATASQFTNQNPVMVGFVFHL